MPKHDQPRSLPARVFARISALLLFLSVSMPVAASFIGVDDFSTTSGSWSSLDSGSTLNAVGGRLEFTTSQPSFGQSEYYWTPNYGSQTQDWSLRVDVFLAPGIGWPANLNLMVVDRSDPDPNGNRFLVHLRPGFFYADSYTDRILGNAVFAPTGSRSATLAIEYDAGAMTLTAKYDADGSANGLSFTSLYTASVSAWTLSGIDPFAARLWAQSPNDGVSLGGMSYDNFVAAGPLTQAVTTPAAAPLFLLGLFVLGMLRGANVRRAFSKG